MLLQTTDLNISEMVRYSLTNILPVDMTIIGLLILLAFGFVAWKFKVSSTTFYPLMFLMFYGLWLGTGGIFPFSALLVISFAIIGLVFITAVFKLASVKV